MSFSDIHLIGCGGTGTALAPALARLAAYHDLANEASFNLWDGDIFEAHNLTRQVCGEAHTDQNKAEITQALMAAQGLIANAHTRYATADALEQRLGDCPLVIPSVDNDATRAMTLRVLSRREGPFFWISPGNNDNSDGQNRISCSVLWWGRLDGVEVGIDPRQLYANLAEPDDDIPGSGGCMEHAPSVPQLITANALAAVLTLTVIQNLLDGKLPARSSSAVMDGRTLKLSFF